MLSGTIAFLLGVLSLYQLPRMPETGLFILLGLFSCVYLRYPFSGKTRWLPLIFVIGFAWAGLDAQQRLIHPLSADLEGVPIEVLGRIDSLPQHDARVLKFVIRVEQASAKGGHAVALPERIRLSWYNATPHSIAPGQLWSLQVKLKRPRGMSNPGGFDYEQWLFQKGIGASGYVVARHANRLLSAGGSGYRVMRIRYAIQGIFKEALASQPMRGIITALAIGDRSAISDAQWDVLLATGTNHLVAISGLHVGLAAGLTFWLVSWLWRFCPYCCLMLPAHRAAALVAMLAAIAYASLAGFSIPTQRAMIMLAVVLGAVWWRRPLQAQRVLIVALWAVLLHDPIAVLAPGFWLSFAAVAWILYGMRGRVKVKGLWWRWGRVQLLVSLGLLPFLLFFFQQGSLAAPLANLVAVPWVSLLVVPLVLAGVMLLAFAPGLGSGLLQLAATLMQWLWPVLQWLADVVPVLPLAAPGWTLIPATAGLLWLFAPRGWPFRAAGAVLLLPMLLSRPDALAYGTAQFTMLDVGQGLSAVIQTRNHTLVFDTGPGFPSGFDTGDAVVVPFLRSKHIGFIDTLIVSHRGKDHSGGARSILEQMPVKRVLSSIPLNIRWFPHELCVRGQSWHWDGVTFRILNPSSDGLEHGQNERSCVLRVTAGRDTVLLTADIEKAAERSLLASGEDLSATILQAPHHGSKSSSTEAFIRAVSPQVVLFSVGYRNRYDFPNSEVVQRYIRAGARCYRSDASGALQFKLGSGNPVPDEWRMSNRKIWHM